MDGLSKNRIVLKHISRLSGEKNSSPLTPACQFESRDLFQASIIKQSWELYFHSGSGVAQIAGGKIIFSKALEDVKGCLAVLKYH